MARFIHIYFYFIISILIYSSIVLCLVPFFLKLIVFYIIIIFLLVLGYIRILRLITIKRYLEAL